MGKNLKSSGWKTFNNILCIGLVMASALFGGELIWMTALMLLMNIMLDLDTIIDILNEKGDGRTSEREKADQSK